MSNLTKLTDLVTSQTQEIAALRTLAGKLTGEQAILLDRIATLTDDLAAAVAGSEPVPDTLVAAAEANSKGIESTRKAMEIMDTLVPDAAP